MKISVTDGNKGVIKAIIPDNEMPTLDNGVRADVIFNAFSVINRLSSGALYEIELNFISSEIVDKIKKLEKIKDKEKLFFKYLKMVHEGYAKQVKESYDNCKSKKDFFNDIETNGIYLLQPPFFGNISFEQLGAIYNEFDIKPRKATMAGKPIMQPLIIGDQYIMRLKHDPSSKFSARSSSHVDIRNRPSKSLSFKRHTSPISHTPIRIN